jgi:triosephosphate isomerase
MRDFLVAGNWKMHGSQSANAALTSDILAGMPGSKRVRLLICPPFPYLLTEAERVAGSRLLLGAQNVSQHDSGAFTGEVAPSMLRDTGCEYVIVGHSERRAMMGESSKIVAAKFVAAQSAGLIPILCVGETLQEREAEQTEGIIDGQLNAVLEAAGVAAFGSAVIAYEPVWAIGTGRTASPEQAQEVHAHIRSVLSAEDESVAQGVRFFGDRRMCGGAGLITL